MFIFDLTNPLTLLLVVLATALLIFLGQEIKKSSVAMIPLVLFLFSLIAHVVQVSSLSQEYANLKSFAACMTQLPEKGAIVGGTLWTMVMDLTHPSVTYYSLRHFDKPFHLN